MPTILDRASDVRPSPLGLPSPSRSLMSRLPPPSPARDAVIDGVTPSDLESALVGKTIVLALRMGNNLWLRLDSLPFPTFQFGMAGAIYIKGMTLTKYKRYSKKEDATNDLNTTIEGTEKYSKRTVKVFAVASEDMDTLTFEAPRFFRHLMDPSSKKISVMEFEVSKVLEELRLTMDQFIDLCILSNVIIVIALKYDNACVVEYDVSAATVPWGSHALALGSATISLQPSPSFPLLGLFRLLSSDQYFRDFRFSPQDSGILVVVRMLDGFITEKVPRIHAIEKAATSLGLGHRHR
ncbi:hypothetical protein ZIOFF_013411 [Zingiber officinale]|uniref:XPG-I domain-containing protein n=1 Tax=Zingiber officinale TaxID=94328 RepID=A0A8J5HBR8_ZINOF|nr:hypothetical protein ZIOFF_013411 [Zingiber officinale]